MVWSLQNCGTFHSIMHAHSLNSFRDFACQHSCCGCSSRTEFCWTIFKLFDALGVDYTVINIDSFEVYFLRERAGTCINHQFSSQDTSAFMRIHHHTSAHEVYISCIRQNYTCLFSFFFAFTSTLTPECTRARTINTTPHLPAPHSVRTRQPREQI